LLAAQYIETDNIISEEAGCLLHKTATYISVRVRYPESERFHQRAMRIREQQLGPEHPDVAHSLSDLADVYQVQGKYAEAEFLYQRALHIREQVLGLQHPDTAETMLTFRESLKVPYLLSARSRGRN
jgi:tetratricopeptide (TPR) repeat protein